MKVSTDNIVREVLHRGEERLSSEPATRASGDELRRERESLCSIRDPQKIFSVDSPLQLTTPLIKGIELIISEPAESRLNVEPACRKD